MATDKQIAANRANAAKSTGPRTEEGKARVAGNANRHARLAESVLLQSENPERFRAFAHKFYLEHRPKGPTERSLLDMMITARWRLMRISNLEAAGVDYEYELLRNPGVRMAGSVELTTPMRANWAYRNLSEKSRSLDVLNRIEARLQRQFDSAFDRFGRLLAARGKPEPKPLHLLP